MSNWDFLNAHRVVSGPYASTREDGFNGAFTFPIPWDPRRVMCIASDGMGWQHVSVSFGAGSKKCPSWDVMCWVKDVFWEDTDAVIQIHPPKKDYVNYHPGCLHLWKCTDGREQPMPLPIMVGPR